MRKIFNSKSNKSKWNFTPKGEEYSYIWEKVLNSLKSNYEIEYFNEKLINVRKGDKNFYILNLNIGLNTSMTEEMCRDKKLCEYLLKNNNIPVIPHYLQVSYKASKFSHLNSLSDILKEELNKFGKLILKPNKGLGGKDIYLLKSDSEIYYILSKLVTKYETFIINPFREIINEYRVILLKNLQEDYLPVLFLKKNPLEVMGDGKSTIRELINLKTFREDVDRLEVIKEIEYYIKEELDCVLDKGSSKRVSYKCNQSCGSDVQIIKSSVINPQILDIAKKSANILEMNFGCVDVIEKSDGEFEVIEANTRVMSDLFDFMDGEQLEQFFTKAFELKFHLNYLKNEKFNEFFNKNSSLLIDSLNNLEEKKSEEQSMNRTYQKITKNIKKIFKEINSELADEFVIGESPEIYDYYLSFTKGSSGIKSSWINYNFGLNWDTNTKIAQDKVMTFNLLKNFLPCIPHKILLKNVDVYDQIYQSSEELDLNETSEIVIKQLDGTSGKNIWRVCFNKIEIEKIFIFNYEKFEMCFSKFYNIDDEFRVFLVGFKPLLVYKKKLSSVKGDGNTTLMGLIINYVNNNYKLKHFNYFLEKFTPNELLSVPKFEERIYLSWKHNLDLGSEPELVTDISEDLLKIAADASKLLDLQNCAVDIVIISGKPYILEINSNPMFNCFSIFYPNIHKKLLKFILLTSINTKI